MTTSFTINPKILRALIPFISTDTTRYVLNGTHVCIDASKKTIIFVATDGRRLMAINGTSDADISSVETSVEFIIPIGLLTKLPKPTLKSRMLTVEFDGDRISIEGDHSISGRAVVGNYPKWKLVIPKSESTSLSEMWFNPNFMTAFFQAAKILNPQDPSIHVIGNSESNGGYTIKPSRDGGNWIGVLMPVRQSAERGVPSWITQYEDTATATATP